MRLRGAFSLFGMKTATAIDVGAPRHDGSTGVAADILNGIICYLFGIICYLGRVTTVTRCSSSASTRGKPSGELGSSREGLNCALWAAEQPACTASPRYTTTRTLHTPPHPGLSGTDGRH